MVGTPDVAGDRLRGRAWPDARGARPFCEAADPESKGVLEHVVGYAKADLLVPGAPFADLATANTAAIARCAEVNAAVPWGSKTQI